MGPSFGSKTCDDRFGLLENAPVLHGRREPAPDRPMRALAVRGPACREGLAANRTSLEECYPAPERVMAAPFICRSSGNQRDRFRYRCTFSVVRMKSATASCNSFSDS